MQKDEARGRGRLFSGGQGKAAQESEAPADNSLFSHGQIRLGQKEFYLDAKKAASEGKILLANAPTGVGKTAAALSAVLEAALPEKRKVVFLTTRTSHHLQALYEARKINGAKGAQIERLKGVAGERSLKVIDKVAKPKMCLLNAKNGLVRCDYAQCRFSKPPKDAVASLLAEPMSAAETQALGKQKNFCAHFASLSAMEHADLIICDYTYVFEPEILEMLCAKAKCQLSSMDLIVDEAHNLAERIRGMNGQAIDENTVKNALRGLAEAKAISEKRGLPLAADASALSSYLKGTFLPNLQSLSKRLNEGDERQVGTGWLQTLSPDFGLGAFVSADHLDKGEKFSLRLARQHMLLRDELMNVKDGEEPEIEGLWALRELAGFMENAEKAGIEGSEYGVFFKLEHNGEYTMRAVLYDPAKAAEAVFSSAHSAILMSGTLIGKSALVDLLGIERGRAMGLERESYESPFDEAQAPIAIIPEASSRYSGRADPEKMRKMASAIEKAANSCYPYSFAVYYPSYEYMEMVFRDLNLPKFSHEMESRGMGHSDAEERKKRIEEKSKAGKPVALHAVVGGSYSEGVDFRENPFKLIIVAGYPFPKPTASQVAFERYLAQKFESRAKAEECASLLPAAIKTVQAIGRGIRSQSDRCFALLIDDRFQMYSRFFPEGMRRRMQLLSEKGAEVNVREFMKEMENTRASR